MRATQEELCRECDFWNGRACSLTKCANVVADELERRYPDEYSDHLPLLA